MDALEVGDIRDSIQFREGSKRGKQSYLALRRLLKGTSHSSRLNFSIFLRRDRLRGLCPMDTKTLSVQPAFWWNPSSPVTLHPQRTVFSCVAEDGRIETLELLNGTQGYHQLQDWSITLSGEVFWFALIVHHWSVPRMSTVRHLTEIRTCHLNFTSASSSGRTEKTKILWELLCHQ